jgi:hypothetical protein
MKNKFWKWLSLFAYKQIKAKSDVIKLGMPGTRDVDNKCLSFMPGNFTDRGFNHCDGDGHYLCKVCRYYAP